MMWQKSSYSSSNGTCVEVATADDGTVHLRNSQHPTRGMVTLPADAVAAFVAGCRTGELDDLAG